MDVTLDLGFDYQKSWLVTTMVIGNLLWVTAYSENVKRPSECKEGGGNVSEWRKVGKSISC